MTDWCYTFDFTKNDGDFTGYIGASNRGNRAFYSPPGTIPPAAVIGWVAANNFRGLVQIQSPTFPATTFTRFTMTISSPMNGSFQKMEITIPDSNGSDSFVYMGSDLVGMIPFHDGVTTTSFFLGACSDLNNPGQAYTGAITKLVVTGKGFNPFTLDEDNHQDALDTAFTNISSTLQANPSANITTLVGDYKTAIEAAFGVTFDKQITSPQVADDWADSDNVVALHFVRQGLQAVAEAFQKWVECKYGTPVDRFELFRRITGGLTLNNVADEASNVALTTGKTISINRVPSANRQWRMTPNNLIHEIGHSLSRAAGYDTVKLGSIEQALEGNSLISGFTRDGFGPDYLRTGITQGDYSSLFYIHTQGNQGIHNDNGTAVFVPKSGEPTLSPENYLLHDLFGDKYDLWNSGYNHLGLNGRIDIFVHNWPDDGEDTDMKIKEIVADAFLNWVRHSFEGTTGTAWQTFFDEHIGRFMRNAAIYWKGMSTHYTENNIIRSTQTDERDFTQVPDSQNELGWPNLRLVPVAGDDDNLIGAITISERTYLNSKIYGWWQDLSTSPIWLLVDSQTTDGKRLAWVIAAGVLTQTGDLADDPPPLGNRILDYSVLNPDRTFSETDLCTLLGLLIEECDS